MWKCVLINISALMLSAYLCSCGEQSAQRYRNPKFPIEKKIQAHILTDTALIAYPYDLCVDDSCLYVLSLVEGNWVQVYDKSTGKWIYSGVKTGQGPNEVTNGSSLSFDIETRRFSLYDQGQSKLLTFAFDKRKKCFSRQSVQSFAGYNGGIRMVWPLDSIHYLIDGKEAVNKNRLQRFQLYDMENIVSRFDSFPISDVEKDMAFILASKSLSPDKTKFAVGTLWGGILELFQISDRITNSSTRYFAPIDYRFIEGAIRPVDETVYGFSSLLALDDKLYGIWIGNKNPNHTSSIVAFDWSGNELVKYDTDCILLRIGIDAEDSTRIYAVAASEEKGFYIVYFDLM